MVAANPLWRAPRIHGELKILGIVISERGVFMANSQNHAAIGVWYSPRQCFCQ
jgi:hypothetical protein